MMFVFYFSIHTWYPCFYFNAYMVGGGFLCLMDVYKIY